MTMIALAHAGVPRTSRNKFSPASSGTHLFLQQDPHVGRIATAQRFFVTTPRVFHLTL